MSLDDVPAGGASHTDHHRALVSAIQGGITGADGESGFAGEDITIAGGQGNDGSWVGGAVTAQGGGTGEDGRVSILTDALTGDAGQVLTADGTGYATWEDAAGGSSTVRSAVITLTPGNLTDSVVLPAGGWLIDTAVETSEAWDGLPDNFSMGDSDDPNGFSSGYAISGLTLDRAYALTRDLGVNNLFDGPYIDNAAKTFKSRYPAGTTLTFSVGATDPTVGATHVLVTYAVPA